MKRNINKMIGKDLKKIRFLWGIGQAKMGRILSIDQSALCRVEKGQQRLSFEQAIKMKVWLNKQPNVFLDY